MVTVPMSTQGSEAAGGVALRGRLDEWVKREIVSHVVGIQGPENYPTVFVRKGQEIEPALPPDSLQ